MVRRILYCNVADYTEDDVPPLSKLFLPTTSSSHQSGLNITSICQYRYTRLEWNLPAMLREKLYVFTISIVDSVHYFLWFFLIFLSLRSQDSMFLMGGSEGRLIRHVGDATSCFPLWCLLQLILTASNCLTCYTHTWPTTLSSLWTSHCH